MAPTEEEAGMKWIALVLVAAALAVPAGQAKAATQKGPTLAQFNALKKQVTNDQKKITQLANLLGAALAYDVCLTAATADAFQSEWQAIDANLTALGRPAVFGPQTPISDLNACQGFKISRSHSVPPTTANFAALTALLGPGFRYSALGLLLS
jgi:hypothetical protein